MRIIRFLDSLNEIHHGVVESDSDTAALRISGDILANFTVTHQKIPIKKILAPVAPTVIYCIGTNYRKHAEEVGAPIPEFPVVFMKNPAAVQNPNDPIEIPTHLASTEVDWECELAVIIGKRGKNIPKEKALEHVLGYACANDVSARDWQKKWGGSQWCRGKTFDTFCPLGPAIITRDEIPNPNTLAISTQVNGQSMQSSSTADMIFDVPTLIAFLSGSTTLLPGTVILTGTPSGVGSAMKPPRFLQPNDTISIQIEKIGTLTNPVTREK